VPRPPRFAESGAGLRLGLVLMSVLLLLPGCTSAVELRVFAAPTALPAATVIPREHAIAIIGVDFDPPLDYGQLAANSGVSLLVAVHNEGLSPESDIRVKARLLDPAAQSGERELLNEIVSVKMLVPGELRVVRFSQVSALPERARYELEVQVEPVPGETDTTDNFRTYEIAVRP
jgi:hypothetical protein